MKTLLTFFVLFFSSSVVADYYVTGKITGGETKFFGFALKIVNVDAVKKDDQFFSLNTSYKTVSEYDANQKRCWINFGKTGRFINFFKGTSFYEKEEDGTYRKLKLDYLTFPCIKK